MRKMNSLILHSGIVFYYAVVYVAGVIPVLPMVQKISDTRLMTMVYVLFGFLTLWNFLFQTISFAGYFVYDILEVRQKHASFRTKLKRYLDEFFYSIVVTKSILVFVLFWIFYSIDPGLVFIYPNLVGNVLAPWVNHALHTNIVPLALLQVYHNQASPVKYSAAKKNVLTVVVLYVSCLYGIYFLQNVWVYPFLNHFYEPFRLFFLIIIVLAAFGIHYVFYNLNEWYCSTGAEAKIHKSN